MMYPPVTPMIVSPHATAGERNSNASWFANTGAPRAPTATYANTAAVPQRHPINEPANSTPNVCKVTGVGFSGR